MDNNPPKTQFIDEGGYGCVFYPGIDCSGKKEMPRFITKIQKVNDTFKNELKIAKHIREIKGYTKYFAPVIKACPVKLTKSKLGIVRQCNKFADTSKPELESPSYISSKIRYVGKQNIGQYINAHIKQMHSLNKVLQTHIYLLNALDKLNRKGIIHFDIKYDNIVYDQTLQAPIIIDFGLSIYKPNLSPANYAKEFFVFVPYSYWCIDITICNYIFQVEQYERAHSTEITEAELERIYANFISGMNREREEHNSLFSMELFPESAYHEFKEKYTAYFRNYIGKPWFELYEHLIRHSDTWDNYSLSMVYMLELDEVYKTHPEIYAKIVAKEKYVNVLQTVLFSMPQERPTFATTIKDVKRLL